MNYKFNGTPGPWITNTKNDLFGDRSISKFEILIDEEDGHHPICDGYGNLSDLFPSVDQGIANSYLIAAAPDMLEALIKIDDLSDLFTYPEVSAQFESEARAVGTAMQEVKKAIHKALNIPL